MFWANGGSVDVSFMHGEYGFSSMRSWCYSRKWVWNSRTKLLHCFRGVNASRVSLQVFEIRYVLGYTC